MKVRSLTTSKPMSRSSQTLDSVIRVFDREYTRYHPFCELKHGDDDFVILLWSDTRIDDPERVQNIEVIDRNGTRQTRDARIELAETGE